MIWLLADSTFVVAKDKYIIVIISHCEIEWLNDEK